MKVDLHTHSNCSDGALAPGELLAMLAGCGVEAAAITDHDTLAAYDAPPSAEGITLVPGIELSAQHGGGVVHVLGLGIDPADTRLRAAVGEQRAARADRAWRIGVALAAAGLPELYGAACELAGHEAPGRPHFAGALVAAGRVRNEKQAFRRHLARGKRGDVPVHWLAMGDAVACIQAAGGVAVLAHPARYKLGSHRRARLVAEFAECGGRGLEVVSGRQEPDTTRQLAAFATAHGLLASVGSDFHSPAQTWLKPGRLEPLPPQCEPIWPTLLAGMGLPAGTAGRLNLA